MKKRYIILSSILLILAIGFYYWQNRWHYIVIHHSAGDYGNTEK